jgi:hypothetical protein
MSQPRLIRRLAIEGQPAQNAASRDWHTSNAGRLPGLQPMHTPWVCNVAGGPVHFAEARYLSRLARQSHGARRPARNDFVAFGSFSCRETQQGRRP